MIQHHTRTTIQTLTQTNIRNQQIITMQTHHTTNITSVMNINNNNNTNTYTHIRLI